jgi:hypothetical protein
MSSLTKVPVNYPSEFLYLFEAIYVYLVLSLLEDA